MKRLVFLGLLILFFTSLRAQTDDLKVWNKWCAKKDTMLLFIHGNNLIQVYSPTIKPADLRLKVLDKSLRIGTPEIKGDTLSVLAMPFPEKGKQMRMAILNKKNSKPLKTIEFRCDSIPRLMARIGNIEKSEAARKDILAQVTMKAYFPKSLYAYPYEIKGYTFKISTPKGGATIPVKGFFINNEVQKEISAAPENTVVDFIDIKASCPDCTMRTLDNIKMKIKP